MEEAAIVFSGRVSLNGLLPSPGPVTRTVEGGDQRGAARVGGAALREAEFRGATRIGATVLGGCAGWGFAGGGALRAISPAESWCTGLGLRLTYDLDSTDRLVTAEDGAGGHAPVGESAGRVSKDRAGGLSARDSSVCGAGGFIEGVTKLFAGGGAGEVISPGRLGSAGDVASTAAINFWTSGRRFSSGTRPTKCQTVRLITTNKNTNAATWNPGIPRTYKCEGEPSIGSTDDLTLAAPICVRKPETVGRRCTFSGRSWTSGGGPASRISGVTTPDA